MTPLEQQAAAGAVDGVDLAEIAASYGTPAYIYSAAALRARCAAARASVAELPDAQIAYAVKANGNLTLLGIIAETGLGFDVGSLGELERVESACSAQGGLRPTICFTGPCKTDADISAAVEAGLDAVICESEDELARVERAAQEAEAIAQVGVRVNPDIDAHTHPHIATGLRETKFGIEQATAQRMMAAAAESPHLAPAVLHCHIGSQIASAEPLIEAAAALLKLRAGLAGEAAACAIDLGGGFGIGDADGRPASDPLADLAGWLAANGAGVRYGFQPGRSIVAPAGVLLARVEYVKGDFILADAGMNDLIRPALYGARHPVAVVGSGKLAGMGQQTVAGPVCETGDFLARNVALEARAGDLLAVGDAGAYGFAMASNYNGRPRPCELVIDDGRILVARRRETVGDMLALEANIQPGA